MNPIIYCIISRLSFGSLAMIPVALRSDPEAALIEARSLAEHAAPSGATIEEQGDMNVVLNFFIKHPAVANNDQTFITVLPIKLDEPLGSEIFQLYETLRYVARKGK